MKKRSGYYLVSLPEHPYADTVGRVYFHRLVMENHISRYLLPSEVVHHKDGNRENNDITNLELFQNNAEHMLHHAKERVFKATGRWDMMKCVYCQEHDEITNLYVRPQAYQAWHLDCAAAKKRVKNPKTGPYKYGVGTRNEVSKEQG